MVFRTYPSATNEYLDNFVHLFLGEASNAKNFDAFSERVKLFSENIVVVLRLDGFQQLDHHIRPKLLEKSLTLKRREKANDQCKTRWICDKRYMQNPASPSSVVQLQTDCYST